MGKYPFNKGDHLMLGVIGTSFSVEYIIKGIYESTVGRTTEILSLNHMTEEDKYAQKVAEEYANFIPAQAWFDFPYEKKLINLWKETNLIGHHTVRKLERRVALTTEYSVKALYALLIRTGSHLTYDNTSTYMCFSK